MLGDNLVLSPTTPGAADWFRLRVAAAGNVCTANVTATNQKLLTQNTAVNYTAGQPYLARLRGVAGAISWLAFVCAEASGANSLITWFDFATGAVGTVLDTGFSGVTRTPTDLGGGQWQLEIEFTPDASQGAGHNLTLYLSNLDNTLNWNSTSGQGLTLNEASIFPVLPDYGDYMRGQHLGVGLGVGF
jgi:hypothetical protein